MTYPFRIFSAASMPKTASLITVLISRRQHPTIGEHWLQGSYVIEANDLHLACLARGLHGGHGTEGHVVVGAKEGLYIRVRGEDS